ncbi:mucin-15 isoform X2 [Carlito syrichta]|uniref:Mucin-15 isoform X2 n=1 Tax=Carlito syrichta TaxID=1868482 RepID=A0A1U7T8Y2_CARSF|nr:mucin-15 isoform X2 [Carlito syrichta]
MLTLAKILLISTLSSSLLFEGHGKETLDLNTTQSIADILKTMGNQPVSLESEANLSWYKAKSNTTKPKTSLSPPLVPFNKTQGSSDFSSNSSAEYFPSSSGPTPTFSTSSPMIHGFVSKLPWNASLADDHSLPVSGHPNATPAVSLENFTWSLINETMKAPDNTSATVSILPPEPTTTPVTPLIMEPTEWLTTTSDSFAGFTPYREKTTLQPTLKFTNNSKLFPNTSDPDKVLRLDNAPEPYDVSFGNSSYYNPTVNDSSMPEGRETARDGIPMDDIPPLRTSV